MMSLALAQDIEVAWDLKDRRMFTLTVSPEMMQSVQPRTGNVSIIDWHPAGSYYFGFGADLGSDITQKICVYVLTVNGVDNYKHIGYLHVDQAPR